MMKKVIVSIMFVCMVFVTNGCSKKQDEVKIGVSFGVGAAQRWDMEATYMQEKADELGIEADIRVNRNDEPKTQEEDCIEMIDNGIDVLVLTPRDVTKANGIVEYAKKNGVEVISYARLITGVPIDLFVGYDSNKIGQMLGQYLVETVDTGNYIVLKGDPQDYNSDLLYNGAMRYIEPIQDKLNIILNENVEGWSADVAEKMVLDAITKNDGNIDAILAPNDKLAGACAKALKTAGVEKEVYITGMDAEIDAVKRILNKEQSVTVYMDLKELATTAIQEAYHMATNEKVTVNASFENNSDRNIDAYLITGKLVTDKNIDSILIDSGYYTKEQIYGN